MKSKQFVNILNNQNNIAFGAVIISFPIYNIIKSLYLSNWVVYDLSATMDLPVDIGRGRLRPAPVNRPTWNVVSINASNTYLRQTGLPRSLVDNRSVNQCPLRYAFICHEKSWALRPNSNMDVRPTKWRHSRTAIYYACRIVLQLRLNI